jgi:hypothetical protein
VAPWRYRNQSHARPQKGRRYPPLRPPHSQACGVFLRLKTTLADALKTRRIVGSRPSPTTFRSTALTCTHPNHKHRDQVHILSIFFQRRPIACSSERLKTSLADALTTRRTKGSRPYPTTLRSSTLACYIPESHSLQTHSLSRPVTCWGQSSVVSFFFCLFCRDHLLPVKIGPLAKTPVGDTSGSKVPDSKP